MQSPVAGKNAAEQPAEGPPRFHRAVHEQLEKDVWSLTLCVRIINAFCIATFFQPDEYYQALEPAWRMAFGSQSGAWITWVLLLLSYSQIGLTPTLGMAKSIALIFASCIVCCCVLRRDEGHDNAVILSTGSGFDSSTIAQIGASSICSTRRLLYVEVCRENIWRQQQCCMDCCMFLQY